MLRRDFLRRTTRTLSAAVLSRSALARAAALDGFNFLVVVENKRDIPPWQRAAEYVAQFERYKQLQAEGKGMPQYYDQTPEPRRADRA